MTLTKQTPLESRDNEQHQTEAKTKPKSRDGHDGEVERGKKKNNRRGRLEVSISRPQQSSTLLLIYDGGKLLGIS